MTRRLAQSVAMLALATCCLGARRLAAGEPVPPVPVTVRDVRLDQAMLAPVVLLETQKRDRVLAVVIGHAEAMAILSVLRREPPPPRPMTHDLLKNVIAQLGGKLERVVITRLEGGTFYASLIVRRGDAEVTIDARPSDGMALALRAGAGVFVAQAVLDEAGQDPAQLREDPAPRPPRPPIADPDQVI